MVFSSADVVAALPAPAAVLDAGGSIVTVNDAWRRSGDLPTVAGDPLPPVPPSPRDGAAVAEAIAKAAAGETAEVVCNLRDGSRARLRFGPLPDAEGNPFALVTVGSDVDNLPASTQAFGDEQWFRTLVEALDQGFTLQDAQGSLLAWNSAAEQILGLVRHEAGPSTPDPNWRAMRLDGTPMPDDQLPAMISLRTGRPCSDVLMGVQRSDGELTWVSANSRPLLRPGSTTPYAVVTSFLDITERRRSAMAARRSDRRLAALVAVLPSGILVENPQGKVALANEEFCRLFDLDRSPEQLAGTDCREITTALAPLVTDPDQFLSRVDELRASGAQIHNEELPLRNGRTVERDFLTVDVGEAGRETLWVYRDITLHKQAEQEIAEARDEALATSRAKSEFLATLSHEVRTPMTGIVGMVDVLISLPLDPDVREVVEGVRLSADALTTMLNDMVDLARIEVGRLQLDEVPFDPRELVDGVAETLGSRARQKALSLVAQVSPDTPARLRGDDARLRQILLNLIGNAVKFTDHGEIVVSVAPRRSTAGRELVIEVRDTGPGMAPDAIDRVFEPFVQEDASTARRHGGSGLGLAITARLVRLMHGRVEVESTLNQGSTFRVVVPLVVPEPGDEEPPEHGERLAGRRVLLGGHGVPRSAAAIAEVLRTEGAAVEIVDGELASELHVRRTAGQTVDVVLCLDDARDTGVRARMAGLTRMLPTGGGVLLVSRTDPPRGHPTGVTVLALPVRPDRLIEAARGGVAAAPRKPAAVDPLPGGRVLLAEDNDVNRAIIGRMLDLLGVRWSAVPDGAAAVEAALGERYDVILMDIQMPGTDGVEATRRIRDAEREWHTPIVALTANAMGGDREAYLAAGMDDYLAKPMRLAALRSTLERYVSARVDVGVPDLDEGRLTDLEDQLQDLALVTTTVELFLAELPGRCEAITEAGEQLDRQALMVAAHTLKSASAMLGAVALAELCERLETLAEEGEPGELRTLAAAAQPTAARTEVAIRRYLSRGRSPV